MSDIDIWHKIAKQVATIDLITGNLALLGLDFQHKNVDSAMMKLDEARRLLNEALEASDFEIDQEPTDEFKQKVFLAGKF